MKQTLIAFIAIVSQSYAQTKPVCGGFPAAANQDCYNLVDANIGESALAPVTNGRAVITLGSCAIASRTIPGSPITRDYLARRGNTIYYACDNPTIAGYLPENPRTCMLHKDRYV